MELDRYYTPQPLADWIVRELVGLRSLRGARVLEPSCGGGAFVNAAIAAGARTFAIDLDPLAQGLRASHVCAAGDFPAMARPPGWGSFRYVIGNPPYRDAQRHVERAIDWVEEGGSVFFLLRQSFLESVTRYRWLRDHMPWRVVVLAERPSFTGTGTDACSYAVFEWVKGKRPNFAHLFLRSWKEPSDASAHGVAFPL